MTIVITDHQVLQLGQNKESSPPLTQIRDQDMFQLNLDSREACVSFLFFCVDEKKEGKS